MKRGDLVLIQEAGTPASKARPCVVVHRNGPLVVVNKVTVCPLTSQLTGAAGQRPMALPTDDNGLRKTSEVEIDWIFTDPVERIGGIIGALDDDTMDNVDIALRRWLDL